MSLLFFWRKENAAFLPAERCWIIYPESPLGAITYSPASWMAREISERMVARGVVMRGVGGCVVMRLAAQPLDAACAADKVRAAAV